MKQRLGFVSNSSSCSFIIDKNKLTEDQEKFVKHLLSLITNDNITDIELKNKIDVYELEVDFYDRGNEVYLIVSQELNNKNIKYGVEWY